MPNGLGELQRIFKISAQYHGILPSLAGPKSQCRLIILLSPWGIYACRRQTLHEDWFLCKSNIQRLVLRNETATLLMTIALSSVPNFE